ncbi:DUF2258 domain-containing protein [Thermogladius sp. 4427co]|uniref:DUF2258 domain-containing protein n=1 Tax=Thermogladius sp. 4427co TaxID=3450718 RepID=UPI003F792F1A
MSVVKTGPVRLSGYAIKLRRVVNASVSSVLKERPDIQKKDVQKKVNEVLTNLNKLIYSLLVEKYMAPKDAIVNIELEYEISDTDFKLKNIKIELYELNTTISDEATSELKKMLGI